MIYEALAVGLVALASYFDIKSRVIPRELTMGGLGLGLGLRFLDAGASGNELIFIQALISVTLTFVLVYLLWRLGGIAGGDAKLLTALAAYVPIFPGKTFGVLSIIPFVPVIYNGVIAVTPFLLAYAVFKRKDIIQTIVDILRRSLGFSFLSFSVFAFFSSPINWIAFMFMLFIPFKEFVFLIPAILALAKSSAMELIYQFLIFFGLSGFFELTVGSRSLFVEKKRLSELKEGDIVYDFIVNGRVVERNLKNYIVALTSGIIPASRGLTSEEISTLRSTRIKEVRVQRAFPFTPIILLGLIVSFLFGDLIVVLSGF